TRYVARRARPGNGTPRRREFTRPTHTGHGRRRPIPPGDPRAVCRSAPSPPETPLARGVGAQRAQEVDLAERGPVGLAEVELAVDALPEQEPTDPLLAGRADHQVRVGLAARVQVLGDVLDRDRVGQVLQRDAGLRLLLEQRAHRTRDLVAPAVADRAVDVHALDVGRRPLRGAQPVDDLGGQQVELIDDAQPPAARVGERLDRRGDDLEQLRDLGRLALEVVGREQPEGDEVDANLLAPPEQVGDAVRTGAVALGGLQADGARPPTVAVEHDADVSGEVAAETGSDAALVEAVQEARRTLHQSVPLPPRTTTADQTIAQGPTCHPTGT